MSGYLPFEVGTRPAGWQRPTLPDLSAARDVYVDTETTGLRWFDGHRPLGIAVATPDTAPVYLPFAHRGGDNLDEETVRRWAQQALRGKRIIGHNLQFDLQMLRVWGVDLREQDNTFRDTMHMAALADDHRRSFSMKSLAKDLGFPLKGEMDYKVLPDLPGSYVSAYAEHDLVLTRLFHEHFLPILEAEGQQQVLALEGDVIPATVEMMANGCPLDMGRLQWMTDQLTLRMQDYLWQVVRLTGRSLSPSVPSDWKWLFAHEGAKAGVTAKGAASFTADVVSRAAEHSEPIRCLYRAGKIEDLLAKFLRPWAQAQVGGVLYPQLNQLMGDWGGDRVVGTVSGRYSCTQPNMQQVLGKDKYRRAYDWLGDAFFLKSLLVPPGGEVWLSADAKAIEMRIFAEYSKSEKLIQAYIDNPDMDPHALVQSWIAAYRPQVTRTEAKGGSFSKLYGSGLETFARTVGVSLEEATVIRSAYDRALPEAKTLFDRAMHKAATEGWVRTKTGRRTRFPRNEQGRRERTHKALNAIIQGFAADVNKMALRDIYRNRRTFGLTMRMTVHDSNESTAPAEAARPYAAFLNALQVPMRVPLRWDTSAGPSWGETTPVEIERCEVTR